jgi:hypothetical protein
MIGMGLWIVKDALSCLSAVSGRENAALKLKPHIIVMNADRKEWAKRKTVDSESQKWYFYKLYRCRGNGDGFGVSSAFRGKESLPRRELSCGDRQ